MNGNENLHLPSPEFRASLEREVVRAFRRQSQFSVPPSTTRRARLRTVATLAIGLVLGVGGAVATAQVQSNQQRDSLLTVVTMKQKLASMRLEIAEANLEELLKLVRAGVRPESDVFAAKHEQRVQEFELERAGLDAEEVRASATAPRDELWAPLVGSRDFVTERLLTDINAAIERQLANQERQRALFARQAVGLAGDLSESDAETIRSTAQAEGTSNVLITKRDLRRRFLARELSASELPAITQRLELTAAVNDLTLRVDLAQRRAKRAKDLSAVGAASQIDVKRAELEVLERIQDLQQVQKQLKLIQAAQALKKKD